MQKRKLQGKLVRKSGKEQNEGREKLVGGQVRELLLSEAWGGGEGRESS